MSIGTVLVALALALVAAAYLARPFRVARAGADLDRAIEAWVAQARAEGQGNKRAEEQGSRAE